MFPIQSDGHWILVVISMKYKQIMMCDSLDNNDLPLRCVDDSVSFLRYYYPEIPETDWRYDTLNAADRFQNAELNTDCGFHIINFMHAALKNARIPLLHDTFNEFKARTDRILNDLTNHAQALITSPLDVITQEQIEDTPQEQVEDTPQVPSQETVNNLDQI